MNQMHFFTPFPPSLHGRRRDEPFWTFAASSWHDGRLSLFIPFTAPQSLPNQVVSLYFNHKGIRRLYFNRKGYGDSSSFAGTYSTAAPPSPALLCLPSSATRRVGALVALAAASALIVLLPAAHHVVVLALHAVLLLGSAAIQLAPAHRAVADLARRAAEAARTAVVVLGESARAAAWLRWVGFASVLVIYALYYVAGELRAEEASSLGKVQGLLLFLIFLAAVWAVFVSMVTGKPAAAAEDELDGGEVNVIADSMIC